MTCSDYYEKCYTAVFFGAPVVVSKITPGGVICEDGAVKNHP